MDLPKYKVFVAKFQVPTHRELITRSITSSGGQVCGVEDYETATREIEKWTQRPELAGVIYAVVHEESVPGQEVPAGPEEVMTNLRQLAGDVPILATYGSGLVVESGTALEKKLLESGADAVLAHPFSMGDFYAALGTAMDKRS